MGKKNYKNIVVMDGSNFNILSNIRGVVKMLNDNRAIDYSVLDDDHPTMIVMEFKSTDSTFEDIQDIVEEKYPGLCNFNVAV